MPLFLFDYRAYYRLALAVEQGSQAAGVAGVVVEIIYARLFIDPDLHYVECALGIDLFKAFFGHFIYSFPYTFLLPCSWG